MAQQWAAAGIAAIVWIAHPMRWDGFVESGAEGPVSGMAFVAVVLGTVAGVLAGLLDHRRAKLGHGSAGPAAVIALLVVSLFALGPIGFFVSRLEDSDEFQLGSSRVLEACAAWLLYVAIAYLLHRVVSGRAFRQAHKDGLLSSDGSTAKG